MEVQAKPHPLKQHFCPTFWQLSSSVHFISQSDTSGGWIKAHDGTEGHFPAFTRGAKWNICIIVISDFILFTHKDHDNKTRCCCSAVGNGRCWDSRKTFCRIPGAEANCAWAAPPLWCKRWPRILAHSNATPSSIDLCQGIPQAQADICDRDSGTRRP